MNELNGNFVAYVTISLILKLRIAELPNKI